MKGHYVPCQDDVHLIGASAKIKTSAWGRKLAGHDFRILHALRMTFGTGYGIIFVMLSFIDDVLPTDKPKSVASGTGSRAVEEAVLHTLGPAHPSDRPYCQCGALRVKKKMGEAWRSSGRPTLHLKSKINQVRLMYYSDATEVSELRKVDSFLEALKKLCCCLEESFLDNSRFQGVQQLLPTCSCRMVVKFLCKLHSRIICCLRPTPTLANPGVGNFYLIYRWSCLA